jgi:hypothetical protein
MTSVPATNTASHTPYYSTPAPNVSTGARVGGPMDGTPRRVLEEALHALEAEATNFAWRFINDAHARTAYANRIKEMSLTVLRDVDKGVVSVEEGAAFANRMRNVIMEEIRGITSAIGRAGAEATKAAGQTLEEAIEKAVQKLFPGKAFGQLASVEKRAVFTEVIEASGRSGSKFTSQIPKWNRYGKGLVVVTAAVAIVNIWMAQNKLKQGIKEGATIAGGALGGAAANASAGFLCGPGAPVCVTVLFVIGGVAGALFASAASEVILDQKEIVKWLGE